MAVNYKEKRCCVRFILCLPLRYVEQKSKKQGNGNTCDLSANGLGFTTVQDLIPQALLELWLEMPHKKDSLYAEGEVVWIKMVEDNSYRAGVSFTKVDLLGLSKILNLI